MSLLSVYFFVTTFRLQTSKVMLAISSKPQLFFIIIIIMFSQNILSWLHSTFDSLLYNYTWPEFVAAAKWMTSNDSLLNASSRTGRRCLTASFMVTNYCLKLAFKVRQQSDFISLYLPHIPLPPTPPPPHYWWFSNDILIITWPNRDRWHYSKQAYLSFLEGFSTKFYQV